MAKKKLELAFISNDSSRKTTFKKRKKGLMKKVQELSVLCGVDACAIISSPFDHNLEVWPSNIGAERVISEFRTLSDKEQQNKMVDQESFIRQRIAKTFDHVKKERKACREMEITEFMFQSLYGNMTKFHMNLTNLNDLGYLVDRYVKDLNRRKEILLGSSMEINESLNVVAISSEGIRPMSSVVASTVPTATITEVSSPTVVTPCFNTTIQQQLLHQQTSPLDEVDEQLHDQNLNLHLRQPQQ